MKKNLIELWGDLVNLKDLLIAILICSVATMGSFFFAPSTDTTKQLFFGLGGAVAGFIICSVLIKPKRTVTTDKEEK